MKLFKHKIIMFACLAAVFFFSCEDKCYYYEEQVVYDEVLKPLSDIAQSFRVTEDFEISKPGNIYIFGKYLLVAEKLKGIHILDNSVPSNPVKVKFIELLGNENFVIVNNTLIADNGPDLLSIDISDMNNITLKNRAGNVNTANVRGDQFIAGYNSSVKKVKVIQRGDRFSGMRKQDMQSLSAASEGGSRTGQGGSMARFAVVDNFLYIVNHSELLPLDMSNPEKPVQKTAVNIWNGNVETIFPYKKYLYMGTSSGVLVYDCSVSKEAPAYVTSMAHFVGCDPVVVFDDIAFSTIRGGSTCRTGNISQLNIYNVASPSSYYQLGSYTMEEPFGLGVNSQQIFVCQGSKGLFVYNWDKSTSEVKFRHSYPEIHATDVIVNGNILIVTAENGLFQFDISNPDNITYLSKLVNF